MSERETEREIKGGRWRGHRVRREEHGARSTERGMERTDDRDNRRGVQ